MKKNQLASTVPDEGSSKETPAIPGLGRGRKSISKKIRFEIFKRDNFRCQYCGKQVPSVVLEIDHIVPVSKGGQDDISNLVTSCIDCNRGKSGNKIDNKVCRDDIKELTKQLKNKQEQLAEYNELLRIEYESKQIDLHEISEYWECCFRSFENKEIATIKEFLNYMSKYEIFRAIDIFVKSTHHQFDYFCGICWTLIKKKNGTYHV